MVFGGVSLLSHWITRRSAIVLVDHAELADGWKQVVWTTIPAAALLLPIAFFLSIARPDAERPTRLVNLAYFGAITLSVGMLTLGVGLPRAA